MFTIIVAGLLVFSNVTLFYVLVNLLKPGQRRIFGCEHANSKRSLPVRSERHHIAVRARSSLARHSGKAATLKALKKLKGCLCANPPEEQLPLFQIHCTDFRRSMDGARAQVREQPRRMSKMHSWPPMEQGIERPMSDLDPVFSVPVLPKILCTVPEHEPAPMAAPLAKPGDLYAEASAALDSRRQAEELRRVLRSMYKNHFEMQSEVSFAPPKGPFAEQAYTMTPTADDLKVELLAHACKLPASGPPPRAGRPARAASAGAELPATFMGASGTQLAQPPMAFPACSSCPPEFWGEEKGQELSAQRPARSMESLLDNLLDMSVAALVSGGSTPRIREAFSAAAPKLLPVSFHSPFDLPEAYSHVSGARCMGGPQEVMA